MPKIDRKKCLKHIKYYFKIASICVVNVGMDENNYSAWDTNMSSYMSLLLETSTSLTEVQPPMQPPTQPSYATDGYGIPYHPHMSYGDMGNQVGA